MNQSWIQSLRWKMLFAALLSASITGVFSFVVYTLATALLEREPYSKFIKWGIHHFGSGIILTLLGGGLFLTSYVLLTRSMIERLNAVQQALKEIGAGNFQPQLPLASLDEVGSIAKQTHETAEELNRYLDEMIQGLKLIASGELEHIIPVKENHKLGEVAQSINQMAQQLSHSIQEELFAEKSKNDLITGVSHDLRTPLTSILGFLEVIQQDRYRDEVEMMHYVDIAHSKAQHLKHLIEDLFEYTRMNNGMPLSSEPLALDDFLEQLMEEYVPIMKSADIVGRLIVEQRRILISADGALLVRAISNILNNAMQYGKEGKYIDITLRSNKHEAQIIIANYGNSIPANELPFIFERFYRVDKSRSLQTGGTGLGLAISKSIIELHNGTIAAESDTHRTAFKLSLPLIK